jgi:hypothetical protein
MPYWLPSNVRKPGLESTRKALQATLQRTLVSYCKSGTVKPTKERGVSLIRLARDASRAFLRLREAKKCPTIGKTFAKNRGRPACEVLAFSFNFWEQMNFVWFSFVS